MCEEVKSKMNKKMLREVSLTDTEKKAVPYLLNLLRKEDKTVSRNEVKHWLGNVGITEKKLRDLKKGQYIPKDLALKHCLHIRKFGYGDVIIEIRDYGDGGFCTIWIKDKKTGPYMFLGKQWRKSETAEKWAEKIKKEYESQGFKVSIERSKAALKVKPSKVIFEKKVPKDVQRV